MRGIIYEVPGCQRDGVARGSAADAAARSYGNVAGCRIRQEAVVAHCLRPGDIDVAAGGKQRYWRGPGIGVCRQRSGIAGIAEGDGAGAISLPVLVPMVRLPDVVAGSISTLPVVVTEELKVGVALLSRVKLWLPIA